ncbi:MAG: hypothetical protein NW207_06355 [Cytophagales bacterium]|nr:hypothetical protein [Cytophagales bacterium]
MALEVKIVSAKLFPPGLILYAPMNMIGRAIYATFISPDMIYAI